MSEMTPEKMAAQDEADRRTEQERQRIDYYLRLRYNFTPCNVDYWSDMLFDQQKAAYKPKKDPSWNQVRKEAGFGFWENAFSFALGDKKKAMDAKKAEARKKLQAEVDEENAAEQQRCDAYNARLEERLRTRLSRLASLDPDEVEKYFTFVLNTDSFSLNGENNFYQNFNLIYDSARKQLVVDYNLPLMDQISQVKEWKVDKNNDVISKNMNKGDYTDLYERILFDLSLRAVGIIVESDSNNLLSSVVFNGSCVYNNRQAMPTVLISFVMPTIQYSYNRICRMDCISKNEIAKLKEARYLGDLQSQKAPSELWERPPVKLVVPIRSSFR